MPSTCGLETNQLCGHVVFELLRHIWTTRGVYQTDGFSFKSLEKVMIIPDCL